MRGLKALLPHACVVLSGVFLVFLVLDDCNPMMGFLTHPLSKGLLALLCALSIAMGAGAIRSARSGRT